jgi:DNA-directed RNA polymerase specialized sigma24 family protein
MQLTPFDQAGNPTVTINQAEATSLRLSPEHVADVAAAVGCWSEATDADTHALAADAVARAVLPFAERTARLLISLAPTLDLDDLTQELTVTVLAALPWAPAPAGGPGRLAAWLSTTLLRAGHTLVKAARREARRERARRSAYAAATLVVDTDEEGSLRLLTFGRSAPEDALPSVLARLTSAEAALLQARASGEPWPAIARRLRCSVRTARRRYEQALTAARRAAEAAAERGTPAAWHPMLAGVASHRAAA